MERSALARDWTSFDPNAYLDEYYADVGPENVALLRFLNEAYRQMPSGGTLLDFGGGPTIYPLISAAPRFDEIHFSDYLQANLDEVRKWLTKGPDAFDWQAFVRRALELETGRVCTLSDIEIRESEIRARVTRLLRCDASRAYPLDGPRVSYDVVLTNFCAESATSDYAQWRSFIHNIVSLLRPGGQLVMSALKGATRYSVGPVSFPAVEISEDDLIEALEDAGFPRKWIELRSIPADRPTRDYQGLILATAMKERVEGADRS